MYGQILVHAGPIDSGIEIAAFLYSNCFLLHTPKGYSSTLQFSGLRLLSAITSGTPLPSQETTL